MLWLPKLFGKRCIATIHGECEIIEIIGKKPHKSRVWEDCHFHLNLFLPVMERCVQRDSRC